MQSRRFLFNGLAGLAVCLCAQLPTAATADDFSAIHGYWQGTHTACGTFSDDFVDIDANGAQFFESTCALKSATRQGDNVYVLKQQCEGFEEETWESTHRFTLTGKNALDLDGQPLHKCKRP